MTITTSAPTIRPVEEDAADRFAADTADHQLTVIRDDGLYKHLRFAKPGTGMYRFDLVTWPGYLTFCGDMGTLVFARDTDMIGFFRSNPDRPRYRINPSYWAEKVQDGGTDSVRVFAPHVFRASVNQSLEDHIGGPCESWPDRPRKMDEDTADRLKRAVEQEVFAVLDWEGEHAAMMALREFSFEYRVLEDSEETTIDRLLGHEPRYASFRFEDYYELARTEWDYRFIWACHAIVWGIEQYDARAQTRATDPAVTAWADALGTRA